MKKKQFNFLLIFSVFFIGILFSYTASAASLRFFSDAKNVAPGSEFKVSVFLDSAEAVNALKSEIYWSSSVAELIDIEIHRSIITLWQGNPASSGEGKVKLEGGILRPFQGDGGEIVTLVMKAKKEGALSFSFGDSSAYLADGKGTPADLDVSAFSIAVSSNAERLSVIRENDATPPVLGVEIIRSPFEERPFVVFTSEDGESGIYGIEMRTKEWFAWNEWSAAENPVLMPAGAWAVEVKAVNKIGVEAAKKVYLWGELLKKLMPFFLIIFIIFALFVYNKYRLQKE